MVSYISRNRDVNVCVCVCVCVCVSVERCLSESEGSFVAVCWACPPHQTTEMQVYKLKLENSGAL